MNASYKEATELVIEQMRIDNKKKKVALVGSAESTLHRTPWKDLDVEIWGLGWRGLPRANRLFDLHASNFIKGKQKNVPLDYADRLNNSNLPVFLCKAQPNIDQSITYPIEEISRFFGKDMDPFITGEYFACSVAFMLCLAIYEGYGEIHMYGLDFVAKSEYAYQKPCMEYYVGVARGMGLHVYLPKGSALCEFSYRYGYEDAPEEGYITDKMLSERKAQYQKKRENALALMHTADGALQEAKQLEDIIHHQKAGGKIYYDTSPDAHYAKVKGDKVLEENPVSTEASVSEEAIIKPIEGL